MIFSFIVFELYFPFAINEKNKIQMDFSNQEIDDEKEFVDLSLLLQKELQINNNTNVDNNKMKQNFQNKDKRTQEKLKNYEKYFYFLLKFLLKKDVKNSKSLYFQIEATVFNEFKKAILTVCNEPNFNSKSQVSVIRKNFEFEILDFYYESQNIMQ